MFREIINLYENKGYQVLLIIELEGTVSLNMGLINEILTVSSDKKKIRRISFFFNQAHYLTSSKNFAINQCLLTETLIYDTELIMQFFFFYDVYHTYERDKKLDKKSANVTFNS